MFNSFTSLPCEDKVYKKIGALIIDEWNGKYQNYNIEFNSNLYHYGVCNYPCATYEGMLDNEKNLPNGFGRIIRNDKQWMADGQFKDGAFHGYIRSVK